MQPNQMLKNLMIILGKFNKTIYEMNVNDFLKLADDLRGIKPNVFIPIE